MGDLVEEIATFLRRTKLPVEQAVEEIDRRWPHRGPDVLDRAARLAAAQLHADAEILQAYAALWDDSSAARRRREGSS